MLNLGTITSQVLTIICHRMLILSVLIPLFHWFHVLMEMLSLLIACMTKIFRELIKVTGDSAALSSYLIPTFRSIPTGSQLFRHRCPKSHLQVLQMNSLLLLHCSSLNLESSHLSIFWLEAPRILQLLFNAHTGKWAVDIVKAWSVFIQSF